MGRILIINCGQFDFSSTAQIRTDNVQKCRQETVNIAEPVIGRLQEYIPFIVYAYSVPGISEVAEIIAASQKQVVNWLGINQVDGNIDRLREKLASDVDRLLELHKDDTFILLASGELSVLLILHLLHLNNSHMQQITQDTGALNLFETRFGVPSALLINDVCHLHACI